MQDPRPEALNLTPENQGEFLKGKVCAQRLAQLGRGGVQGEGRRLLPLVPAAQHPTPLASCVRWDSTSNTSCARR